MEKLRSHATCSFVLVTQIEPITVGASSGVPVSSPISPLRNMSLSNGIYHLKNLKTGQYLQATSSITTGDPVTTGNISNDSVSFGLLHYTCVDHSLFSPLIFPTAFFSAKSQRGGKSVYNCVASRSAPRRSRT